MDKWVNRRSNPQATCSHRLFCFPWAGGGTLFYASWTKLLPENIEVNALRLPGRESRLRDPLYSNLDQLVEELCKILLPSLQEKPFAFFGHSMGAILCFELACYLKKHHNLEPVHMILSGATAPHSTLRQEKVADKPLDQLTDDEFLERLTKLGGTPKEVLAQKGLMRLFIPVIRADLILLEKYSKEAPSEPPLSCPINFFDGAEDRTRNHDIDKLSSMSDQTRVLLWAVPRTCSSILLKSLSNIPDSQMIFELYSTAYTFGPDKLKTVPPVDPYEDFELDENGLLKGQGSGFQSSICTFEWVKRQLEADYRGKKVIIAKEMAPWLNRRYNIIPKGYRHMFLIRNPYKVFMSWKTLRSTFLKLSGTGPPPEDLVHDQLPPEVVQSGKAFKEISDLWLHIKENNLDADPIIIDSDDLLKKPKEILSAVCSRVGIPYSDSLLSWEAGPSVINQWMVSGEYKDMFGQTEFFKNFRNTTCFKKPVPQSDIPDLATLSPDLQHCIESSMPYYMKLFEQRLKC